MKLYIKLAWRNIMRNKRRTIIAGLALGIGLASLIYTDALWIGLEDNMIASATSSFLGEGQINREGFRRTFEAELTINDLDSVMARLSREPEVEHFTERVLGLGMISSPANISSISMVGIDPATEPPLSQIDEALTEGKYLSGDNPRDLLIGRKLAELLEVELGDRVVLTVAEAHTGELSQEMFRVSGIFFFNVAEMDQSMAFVQLNQARKMLGIEGQAHQIAIDFTHRDIGRDRKNPFWARYSTDGNEAAGWVVLLPQLEGVFEMSQFSTLLLGIVLFAVVALVIINSLFMSLYERMFEFGVLRALGTRPLSMGRLIVLEAGALAVISIVLGALLCLAALLITDHYGIDYGGIEFAGVTFRDLLYPVVEPSQFIVYPVAVFLFTLLIALYPAAYAARLKPAEAMRRSF
ncbi:MAG TPA: FtsX-like permease family protein [candidate division Zixibacteria bacterium]|nr:FtsX-like permease family protein [candidate division Zixibacteria bacterium]